MFAECDIIILYLNLFSDVTHFCRSSLIIFRRKKKHSGDEQLLGCLFHSITQKALSELCHNFQLHLCLLVEITTVGTWAKKMPLTAAASSLQFWSHFLLIWVPSLSDSLCSTVFSPLPPLSRGEIFLLTWISDLSVSVMFGWRIMHYLLTKSFLNISFLP